MISDWIICFISSSELSGHNLYPSPLRIWPFCTLLLSQQTFHLEDRTPDMRHAPGRSRGEEVKCAWTLVWLCAIQGMYQLDFRMINLQESLSAYLLPGAGLVPQWQCHLQLHNSAASAQICRRYCLKLVQCLADNAKIPGDC